MKKSHSELSPGEKQAALGRLEDRIVRARIVPDGAGCEMSRTYLGKLMSAWPALVSELRKEMGSERLFPRDLNCKDISNLTQECRSGAGSRAAQTQELKLMFSQLLLCHLLTHLSWPRVG